ncbi:MAG: acetyl-CoA carboxylase biotin carboxyl carrier protein [Clostridia bacterium]|nr:acetyl-CoA carboxylase biotin carboxyl carrier protein [Clostridia bacterium]MBP3708486.1 acetyl-CoA carboxylase biotin carboxyl carrier protein [Clostridia bacterium]
MEYEKIKQLMEDMGNSKLTSLDIDFPDGTKISMKKENTKVVEKKTADTYVAEEVAEEKIEDVITNNNTSNENDNTKVIKSPMVGTFYLRPSPTADPYVEIGKVLSVGDTVCIIEAMKLMNEIESDVAGKVVEIIAKDGEPVEYGAPLFRVE